MTGQANHQTFMNAFFMIKNLERSAAPVPLQSIKMKRMQKVFFQYYCMGNRVQ